MMVNFFAELVRFFNEVMEPEFWPAMTEEVA